MHCIGATTLDEQRKHIEKDAELERRFQPVLIDASTTEDTVSILPGRPRPLARDRKEAHLFPARCAAGLEEAHGLPRTGGRIRKEA